MKFRATMGKQDSDQKRIRVTMEMPNTLQYRELLPQIAELQGSSIEVIVCRPQLAFDDMANKPDPQQELPEATEVVQTLQCPKCEELLEGVEDLFIGYSPVMTICPNKECLEEIWIAWDGTGSFEIMPRNCHTCSKRADACEPPDEGECPDWAVKPGAGLPIDAEIAGEIEEEIPPLSMVVDTGKLIQRTEGDELRYIVISVDPKAESIRIAEDGVPSGEAKAIPVTFAELDADWMLCGFLEAEESEEIGAEAVPEFCGRCREIVKGAACRYANKGQENDCPAWAEHLKEREGAEAG